MKSRAVVATALLALLTMPFADAVATKKLRIGNGVRLVGGSGARGRLEVSSTASWMLADGESVAWRPVCAVGGLIDNGVAQIMCKLLGYKYGRRYFSPDVSYRPPNPNASIPEQSNPVGYVYCNVNARRRRLGGDTLPVGDDDDASSAGHSGGDGVAVAAAAATGSSATAEDAVRALDDGRSSSRTSSSSSSGGGGGGGGSTTRRQRHVRSLLAPLYGFVDMPHDAPYSCQFRLGDCDYTGPLVGIECFKRRMPPAPPPPPSPPRAPQTPPPASMSIRLYGPNGGPLERNMCAASPGLCSYFNRVELQVPSPAGGTGTMIWAPLCSAPPALLQAVGEVVCWQVYNWPRFANRPDFTVISEPSELGFPIPADTWCTLLRWNRRGDSSSTQPRQRSRPKQSCRGDERNCVGVSDVRSNQSRRLGDRDQQQGVQHRPAGTRPGAAGLQHALQDGGAVRGYLHPAILMRWTHLIRKRQGAPGFGRCGLLRRGAWQEMEREV